MFLELPIYYTDLYSGFRYTLYIEICSNHETLNNQQIQVLLRYLNLNLKLFPFDNDKTQQFFSEIANFMSQQKEPFHLNELEKKINQTEGLPKEITWRTCAGSQPKFRGYPCSVWILFHTLTVAEYQK